MKMHSQLLVVFLAVLEVLTSACTKKDSPSNPVNLTCHITSPLADDTVFIGNVVIISAETNLSSDQIEEVRFYIDGTGISTSKNFPYSTQWNTLGTSPGLHSIKATVFNLTQESTNDEINVFLRETETQDTTKTVPVVETISVNSITDSSATIFANVADDGGATVTERGVCVALWPDPDISTGLKFLSGTGKGSFSSIIIGLDEDTVYYARAYAINEKGISYGSSIEFHTLVRTVTDFDGNIYHVVKIGNQAWLKENLKSGHFQDGSPVPLAESDNFWGSGGADYSVYCYYNNNLNYLTQYGGIYNYFSVVDSRKLSPKGWHVATRSDWDELISFLGGPDVAGGKMKEEGTTLWQDNNLGATNESGFTALPGGYRVSGFMAAGKAAAWWSSTEDEYNSDDAYVYSCYSHLTNCNVQSIYKFEGFYVRCVRDK